MDVYYVLLFQLLTVASSQSYSFSVAEGTPSGSQITDLATHVTCTSYQLQNLDSCCTLSDSSLLVATSLDRETIDYYSGSLVCGLDTLPYREQYTLDLTVTDINDNSPYWDQPAQAHSIDEENTPGTTLSLSPASDPDSEPNSVTRYQLLDHTDTFSLSTGTWSAGSLPLSLIIQRKLDYDTGDELFVLRIAAFDPANNTAQMTLTLTVNDKNDNRPVFEEDAYEGSVSEDAGTQTPLLEIRATDADSGANGAVTYSLSDTSLPFVIKANGDLVVTQPLDRETVATYSFTVTASDGGSPVRTQSVSVVVRVTDVNDNEPVIVAPAAGSTIQMREGLAVGSIVCDVQASDADEGANAALTVTLLGNHHSWFSYSHVSGEIGKLTNGVVLDRESNPSFTLVIRVEDGGDEPLSAEVQFTLQLLDANDNHPTITNCGDVISVPENSVGVVFTATVSDPDEGDDFTWSVGGGGGRWEVEQTSGVLTLLVPYDYETTTADSVTLTVTDSHPTDPSLSTDCTFTVAVGDVNDNSPHLQPVPAAVSVPENITVGTELFTLKASDLDATDTLTYRLLSHTSTFTVSATGGTVTTLTTLDRETTPSYEVLCGVFDGEDLHNDTTTVTVTLTDISDTPPVFQDTPYSHAISSNTPTDKVLFTPRVTDADEADPLTFSTSSKQFTVSPNTGELSLSGSLSSLSEDITTLSVPLSVSDPVFTVSATVTVTVYRDTNTPPTLTSARGYTLPENVQIGTDAGVCLGSSLGPLSYSLSGGLGLFTIDEVSGTLRTVGELDYETAIEHRMECGVRNIHGYSVSGAVVVAVSGVNEFPPVFERSVYNFKAYDPPNRNEPIGAVSASDRDEGNDGLLQFYLATPNPGWNVDSGSGSLVQLEQTESTRRRRETPLPRELEEGPRVDEFGSFHLVELIVGVRDSPADPSTTLNSTTKIFINVYPREEAAASSQIVVFGGAAGGVLVLIILLIIIIIFIVRRRRRGSGSKELTFVNPTTVTGKDGRTVTPDGGYHTGDTEEGMVLRELRRRPFTEPELLPPHSRDGSIGHIYDDPGNNHYHLSRRDKLMPHKMSVSTVLSDMRQDVRRPPSSFGDSRTGSIHEYGSAHIGAIEEAKTFFHQISQIHDDVQSQKTARFLSTGDQDSAFSSLGSNGEHQQLHTDYLEGWKPAFQSVGLVCEGLLRGGGAPPSGDHPPLRGTTPSPAPSSSSPHPVVAVREGGSVASAVTGTVSRSATPISVDSLRSTNL